MNTPLAPVGASSIEYSLRQIADADGGLRDGELAGVWRAWHFALQEIIAAPSLLELHRATLRGAMEVSGAQAGRVALIHDEGPDTPPLVLSRPSQVQENDNWRTWPLDWQGESLGWLSLDWDGVEEARAPFVTMLAGHTAAIASKTRLFEQLQTIKREWQAMLDGMIDGVYVCDENGVVLRANRALAELLSQPIPGVLGHRRDDLWSTLPEYSVLYGWRPLEVGPSHLSPQVTEFRCGHPDRVFVEMAFELRPNDDETGGRGRRLCVLHDVTESRRLQEQLLQSEKLAALGELTSGVAHELNNPLATVVGYAELLDLETNLPDSVRRKLSTIHNEATRAAHIVQNLLAYARRSSPEKTFVDINDVVAAAVEMRHYQLHSEDVRLLQDFAPNLPHVWADPLQLQQVLLNIINNAVQAVQNWRGSGEIRLSTRPAVLNGGPGVRVMIEDNGPGIAPEHLRRVFDPFFTTKPTGEGTGLGMSIALRIVSNHDGLIWAESRLGHGARFIIELPAVGASTDFETEALGPHEKMSSLDVAENSGRKILVIDDEEPVVTLISEILMLDGHEVTPAFNGAEAIALLRADDYDLILSDVRMPAVGGPTFFEILQTTRPDLLPRVIFVTGDTMSANTREFLQRADRPVLVKPFDPEKLRRLVREHLPEQ